jgi:hypothetical protein
MKGFRTIIGAVIAGIISLLETTEIINVLPPEYGPVLGVLISIFTIVMRFITDTNIGKSS